MQEGQWNPERTAFWALCACCLTGWCGDVCIVSLYIFVYYIYFVGYKCWDSWPATDVMNDELEVSESKVAGFRKEQLNREKDSNFPIRNSRCSFHLHPPTDNGLYRVSSQSSTSIIWALRALLTWAGRRRTGDGLYLTWTPGSGCPKCCGVAVALAGRVGRYSLAVRAPTTYFLRALQRGGCFSFFGNMPCCRALIQKG